MKGKERFRQLCREANPLPLFLQAWWFDAVAGEEGWDAIVLEEGGRVKAVWPYARREIFGETRIRQPELTQAGGIFLFYPPDQKYEGRLSYEHETYGRLIEELESRCRLTFFRQLFHHDFVNWLPFYWRGYRQTTLYTYRIEAEIKPDEAFAGMSAKLRNEIRKAERTVVIRESDDVELLCGMINMTFARQDRRPSFGRDTVRRVFSAAKREGKGTLLVAEDPPGRICSVSFFVEDEQTTYYLLSGADPDTRSNNAGALLIWDGIRRSLARGKAFDFEGSVNHSIEKFFRSFGAVQTPYMCIYKDDADTTQSILRRAIKSAYRVVARFSRRGRDRRTFPGVDSD